MFKDVGAEIDSLDDELKKVDELNDDLIEMDELLDDPDIPTFRQDTELDHITERKEEIAKRVPGNEEDLYDIIYKLATSLSRKIRGIRGVYLLNSSMGPWKDKEVDEDGSVKNGVLNWILKLGSIQNHVVATIDIDLEIENHQLKKIETFKNPRGESFPFTRKNIISQFSC